MVDSEVIWRVADWFLSSALGALEVIKYQGVGRKRPASIKVGRRKVHPRPEEQKQKREIRDIHKVKTVSPSSSSKRNYSKRYNKRSGFSVEHASL